MATDSEVKFAGLVPGAASPVGIKGVKIVADDSIATGTNFVAGGNKPETHLKNVNYPRDFKPAIMADIAKARPAIPVRSAAASFRPSTVLRWATHSNWARL